jgi:hypothetical protein
VKIAVAAMLLAVLGLPLGSSAFAADDRGLASSASTPASASDSTASASISNANASSTANTTIASASAASIKAASNTTSAPTKSDPLLAATLPNAPTMSGVDATLAKTEVLSTAIGVTEATSAKIPVADSLPAGALSLAPSAADPVLGNAFLPNNSLAPIHALLAPPAALVKLKTPPRSHSFFDARNTLGFATLGASLTADALSTQKGLAYPGFVEMNPIARPFVQTRIGAAAYNAGSFGLMTGLMYWAHKTEHHKLERILPFAIGSWEGLLSARNYHVIANRPR